MQVTQVVFKHASSEDGCCLRVLMLASGRGVVKIRNVSTQRSCVRKSMQFIACPSARPINIDKGSISYK